MRTSVIVTMVTSIVASQLAGQPADSRQAPTAASPVNLTLRVADGRTQFRIGETVPFELEFSSDIKNRFAVDGRTSDRSGRLTIDRYRIEPAAGVADPLMDYGTLGDFAFGGGLGTIGALGDKPFIVKLELNDWFRFDEPGRYRLSVRSSRVRDETAASGTPVVAPVDSNVITIEIVERDVEWEAKQLAALKTRLDKPATTAGFGPACRELRFLGTNGAVDEMIRRYGQRDCGFHFLAGLIGASDRAYVVRQMTARLKDPDQAVDEIYLRTLALLSAK